MKSILFYATGEDVRKVLDSLQVKAPLKYAEYGVFPQGSGKTIETFSDLSKVVELGLADHDSSAGCRSFLVVKAGAEVQPRLVRLAGGTDAVAIDEMLNQGAATFCAGGWRRGDVLLHGRVGTSNSTQEAKMIVKLFETEFKKMFTKVKSFWVGPEALQALKAGKRLTASVHSPSEFDLRVD